MTIFGRYLISEILKLLFPVWMALGFLLFILEWLAQVFNVRASTSTVLLLYAYKMPSHLQLVFPIAVLFACLAVLGTMNRNREIVAAQSLGIRLNSILWPAAMAVALGAAVNYWVMDRLAPWGMHKHYELYDRDILHVPSRFSQIRQEKIWYRNQDVLYNARFFAPERSELVDVTIYTFDEDFHIAQTIFAEKAVWNGNNWILSDGIVSLTDKRLPAPVSERFKTRSTRLIEDPKSLQHVEFNPETLSQDELHRTISRNRALGINTSRWEVIYQSRFSFLLLPFVFLLLAFPIALRFRRTGSLAKDGLFVTVVAMCYWLLYSFGMNLGNAGKLNPVLAAWGPSILVMIFAYFFNASRKLKHYSE